jgi:hypothetical protein
LNHSILTRIDSEKKQDSFLKNPNYIFNIYIKPNENNLIHKIDLLDCYKLEDYVIIYRGIEFGYNSENIFNKRKNSNYKPIIAGRCFGRYTLSFENKYVIFNKDKTSIYKNKDIYENKKLFLRRIGTKLIATYDDEKYYNVCDVYNLLLKDKFNDDIFFLLGIINSKLMSFYYSTKYKNVKQIFPKIPIKNLYLLPIAKIGKGSKEELYKKIIYNVQLILNTYKELKKTTDDILQKKIYLIDNQIDECIYELYEINEEEKKIVENY